MPRTGTSTMPLHYGRAPRWLFSRMTLLAREIIIALSTEFNPEDIIKRFSDPYWFQAFGCVLGFDWHSRGLTTSVMGAVEGGIKGSEKDETPFPVHKKTYDKTFSAMKKAVQSSRIGNKDRINAIKKLAVYSEF